jgi:hypothetical protein
MVVQNYLVANWKHKDPKFSRTFEFDLLRTEPDPDCNGQIHWSLHVKMFRGSEYFHPLAWDDGAIEVAKEHCETAIANLNATANTGPTIEDDCYLRYSGSIAKERLSEFITRAMVLGVIS